MAKQKSSGHMHSSLEHNKLMAGISKHLKGMMDYSEQAMYLYLDDDHVLCNQKFASLLGYKAPADMMKIKDSFLESCVAAKSQRKLVDTYQAAMEKMIGSSVPITWKKKSGKTVNTNLILVPIAYDGHLFALHFITEK